jgi:hypothetical protein
MRPPAQPLLFKPADSPRRTFFVNAERIDVPLMGFLDPVLDGLRAVDRPALELGELDEGEEEGKVGGGGFRTGAEPSGARGEEVVIDLM